jgi:hypothetical protein
MLTPNQRAFFIVWKIADALCSEAKKVNVLSFNTGVEALRPILIKEKDFDFKICQQLGYLQDFLRVRLPEKGLFTFEEQQKMLHMLNVLVEKCVKMCPQSKNTKFIRDGWKLLQAGLIDFIAYIDEESGDVGVEDGCKWADQLNRMIWN